MFFLSKNWGQEKIVKIRFRLFYDKKISMTIKPIGGWGVGKALMALPLREELFVFGFPKVKLFF